MSFEGAAVEAKPDALAKRLLGWRSVPTSN